MLDSDSDDGVKNKISEEEDSFSHFSNEDKTKTISKSIDSKDIEQKEKEEYEDLIRCYICLNLLLVL